MMTEKGITDMKRELRNVLNKRANDNLNSALQYWIDDAEMASEAGHNSFEVRGQYTKDGNPAEIWIGDGWFVND